MNRRQFWLPLFLTANLLVPSILCARARALKKVQVGVPAISMGNIVIYFTKEAKIYDKYGLDVYRSELEEFVDASFVEELDRSGFIKRLYEK